LGLDPDDGSIDPVNPVGVGDAGVLLTMVGGRQADDA
jgi:hypothetical protein